MLIPIVDESDNRIGAKERDSLEAHDIYRVSALWLLNDQNEVLIARRALTKKHNPGCWGCSVAGTVEEGETYESNIIKESMEEVGLVISSQDLRKGPKLKINGQYQHFCQFFLAKTNKTIDEFVCDEREVIELCWKSILTLLQEVRDNPDMYSVNLEECLPLVDLVQVSA